MEKFTWKHIVLALIVLLIGTISIQVNISVGNKIDDAYKRGIETGRIEEHSRFLKEIGDDLNTFGGYGLPVTQQDGTEGKMLLISPARCSQFLTQ